MSIDMCSQLTSTVLGIANCQKVAESRRRLDILCQYVQGQFPPIGTLNPAMQDFGLQCHVCTFGPFMKIVGDFF